MCGFFLSFFSIRLFQDVASSLFVSIAVWQNVSKDSRRKAHAQKFIIVFYLHFTRLSVQRTRARAKVEALFIVTFVECAMIPKIN